MKSGFDNGLTKDSQAHMYKARLGEALDSLGGMDSLRVMVNAKNFHMDEDYVEFELGFDQKWLCTISTSFNYHVIRLRHIPLSSLSSIDHRVLCLDLSGVKKNFERTTKLSLDFH